MKQISLRIALMMLPALIVVLMTFGTIAALREGAVLEREIQRDADSFSRSLAALVEVEGITIDEARRRLLVVEQSSEPWQIALVEGDELSVSQRLALSADDDNVINSAAPIQGADGLSRGWIVLTHPLTGRDAFVRRAVMMDVLGAALAALALCVIAVAIGRTLVQRRVLQVIGRLDSVGRGDFSQEPLELGVDELGLLGEAVDQLTVMLRTAHDEAAREVSARRRAQFLLHRADRLSAVGKTVAVFAHEIGTPLNVIAGRAARLNRPRHPDNVQSDARIIEEQAERIATFVRQLLDYARHDDGFAFVRLKPVALVERAIELVQGRARHASVSIRQENLVPELEVDGDPKSLEQVVNNLLLNAIDASPPDEVISVTVNLNTCMVGGERGLHGQHLDIAVKDRGDGIPEILRPRVFNPFFTTKGAGEGTGLGLSIVEEIVQDHGGAVTLEDPEGGGFQVVLHLPLAGDKHA